MKKKRYIALILILSLFCVDNVNASCTQEQINEFKKIKDGYNLTTELNKEKKTYTMRIERSKPKSFDYVFTIDYSYECNDISETVMECIGLKPGTSFEARIIGVTNQCNDILEEETIELAYFNQFYDDPLCEGIEEFVLCQETYTKELDYDTFKSRVETYKKTKQQKLEEEKQNQTQNDITIDKVTSYIEENLIQITIVVIFIILLIISSIIAIKSIKKSRRLE